MGKKNKCRNITQAGREAEDYTGDLQPTVTLIFPVAPLTAHVPSAKPWLGEAKLSLRPRAAEVLRELPCWSDPPRAHKDGGAGWRVGQPHGPFVRKPTGRLISYSSVILPQSTASPVTMLHLKIPSNVTIFSCTCFLRAELRGSYQPSVRFGITQTRARRVENKKASAAQGKVFLNRFGQLGKGWG